VLFSLVLLIAGIMVLPVGSHILVNGSVALAERLGVSALVVGLTVVAFGTSLPELVVSLNAALSGAPDIAVGNVIGSNIANVLLILGAAALIKPIVSAPGANRRDSLMMLAVTAGAVAVAVSGEVVRWQGALMVAVLVAYIAATYWRESRNGDGGEAHLAEVEEFEGLKGRPWLVILGAVGLGLVGVIGGAHLLVTGAVDIARTLGVPEAIIGLTMVAIGTSLPELAVSVVAALKGRPEVAVGNVIGSNVFNILAILGVTAMVVPVPVGEEFLRFDLWVMLGVAALAVPVLLRGTVGRTTGLTFLALYAAYIGFQALLAVEYVETGALPAGL